MRVSLDQDEVTALLEQQAFAPPAWRKYLFWSQFTLLLLTAIYALNLYQQESFLNRLPPLIRWQQGKAQVVSDPVLSHCLQAWGQGRTLPPAHQLIISATPDGWNLVWLGAHESINYSGKGQIQELCQ